MGGAIIPVYDGGRLISKNGVHHQNGTNYLLAFRYTRLKVLINSALRMHVVVIIIFISLCCSDSLRVFVMQPLVCTESA